MCVVCKAENGIRDPPANVVGVGGSDVGFSDLGVNRQAWGGVGISGIFFSPPSAATKKILALFRVFLLTKVPKNMDFCQILRKKAIFS